VPSFRAGEIRIARAALSKRLPSLLSLSFPDFLPISSVGDALVARRLELLFDPSSVFFNVFSSHRRDPAESLNREALIKKLFHPPYGLPHSRRFFGFVSAAFVQIRFLSPLFSSPPPLGSPFPSFFSPERIPPPKPRPDRGFQVAAVFTASSLEDFFS